MRSNATLPPQLPRAEPHDPLSEAESYGVYRCHPLGARSGKWGYAILQRNRPETLVLARYFHVPGP